jgi:cold shock protein
MNIVVKLVISLVVAAVACTLTAQLLPTSIDALTLFAAFACATVITTLLVSLPGRATTPKRPARSAEKTTAPLSTASDAAREQGKVKWFNVSKGFGFITKDDGEEIFVHFRSIRGEGRRGLRDGQRVSFVVAQSDKGPQAEDVEGLE